MAPLHGLRAVEVCLGVSAVGAGLASSLPGSLFRDLGADVVKIEDPRSGGDISRSVPPYRIAGDSIYFQSFNRNKRSITLDLRTPEGRALFHRLVAVSHAVFNNLRGDETHKLGLDYESLREINPRIVCCSLSGFARSGSRAHEPGYDYLIQAETGYMSMTGDPAGPPVSCGVSVIDYASGLAAALGLVAASLLAGLLASRYADGQLRFTGPAGIVPAAEATWSPAQLSRNPARSVLATAERCP